MAVPMPPNKRGSVTEEIRMERASGLHQLWLICINIANSIKMYHPVSRFQSPGWDPSRWTTRGLKCHDFSQSPWVWLGEEPSDIQRSRGRGRSERAEWPKREHVSLKYFQFIIMKRCYHIKTNLLFSALLPPPSYPGGGGSHEHHTC